MKKRDVITLIVDKLRKHKEVLKAEFHDTENITKTKHFILDDVLPKELVMSVYNSLPRKSDYHFRDTFREKKYTFAKLDKLDNTLPEILTDAFQDQMVIDEVKEITDIDNLEGDPSLYAGGVSRMDSSHFLNPHIDNSHDANRARYRRLNILFYVTPNIDESDGGNFELWDDRVKRSLKIPSLFNRLIVMETTKNSWHSVDPVKSNIKRCCVSNYYFSETSYTGKNYYHVTSFLGRPNQIIRRAYGRIDNFLRQNIASIMGFSRGKKLIRTRN
mgnify:FL=1